MNIEATYHIKSRAISHWPLNGLVKFCKYLKAIRSFLDQAIYDLNAYFPPKMMAKSVLKKTFSFAGYLSLKFCCQPLKFPRIQSANSNMNSKHDEHIEIVLLRKLKSFYFELKPTSIAM
jgi:hypothetical protein